MIPLADSLYTTFSMIVSTAAASVEAWLGPVSLSLLHFLWQGALIAGFAALALRALRRRDARERYAVACLGLASMALAPLLTATLLSGSLGTAADIEAATLSNPTAGQVLSQDGSPAQTTGFSPLSDSSWRASIEPYMPFLLGLWMTGILLMTLMHVGGFQRLRRLRARGVEADALCVTTLQRLQARLGIRRPVDLLQSSMIQSPLAMGWLKPAILVPSNALFGLSPQQLEAVLAHELAHIRRHDYLVNLGQILLETMLFFHPAVWWLSNRARIEREHCCDDVAVSLYDSPEVFARALADLERLRPSTLRPSNPAMALGADGGSGSLLSRIQRLAGAEDYKHRNHSLGSSLLAAAIAAFVAVAGTVLMVGCPVTELDAAELVSEGDASSEQAGTHGDAHSDAHADAHSDAHDEAHEDAHSDAHGDAHSDAHADAHGEAHEDAHSDAHDEAHEDARSDAHDEAHENTHSGAHGDAHSDAHGEAHEHDHSDGDEYEDHAEHLSQAVDELRGWAKSTPWQSLSDADLGKLARHGFDGDVFPALADAGLRPSSEELLNLARHGVDADDVRGAAGAFPNLTGSELVELARFGIDVDDVYSLKQAGYANLTVEEVLRLAQHGVDGEDLQELKAAGLSDLSLDELIELAKHGVDAEDLQELRAAGYGDLPLEKILELARHGMDGEDIQGLKDAGLANLSLEQLMELSRHGIDGDDVQELRAAGLSGLGSDQIIQLAKHGVDGDDVQELRAAGFGDLSVDGLVDLATRGIDGDDIQELQQAGLGTLTLPQIKELANFGIDSDDIAQLREEGHTLNRAEQVLELARNGELWQE